MRVCVGIVAALMLLLPALAQPLRVSYRVERQSLSDFYRIDIRTPFFPPDHPLGALANQQIAAVVREYRRDFLKTMDEHRRRRFRIGEPFQLQVRATVSIARADLISLYLEIFWWTGGAHPNIFYRVVNVGMVRGQPRRLTLADLLERGAAAEHVMERVYQQLEAIKRRRDPAREPWLPAGGIPPEYWNSFILTPSAIVWVFEPYAVGAGAEGEFFVRLPYDALEGLVRRL